MDFLKIHPIYNKYGFKTESDEIIHIPTKRVVRQRQHHSGYCIISISFNQKTKSCLSHRFIWECCNDIIPKGYEIDHINKNKIDNKISNLRCVTMQENRKYRDHTNIINIGKYAHDMKRFIKAINADTGDFCCFSSKSKCAKYFDISPAMVYLIIENKNNAKQANTNNGKYKFEYIDEKHVDNLTTVPHGNLGKSYPKSKH